MRSTRDLFNSIKTRSWKVTTTVATPGVDTQVPTEKAVRDAITSAGSGITQLTGDVTAGPGSGSVAATIANSVVTLAKIANASANDKVLGSGNSGSGAAYTEITLGTGLTMTGTTLSSSGGVGGGGLVLLEQHTASAQATLDFTSFISSSYDCYLFQLLNFLPATSTDDLWMIMGTGGGPTWDTGANYAWAYSQTSQLPNSAVLGSDTGPVRTHIKIAHSLSNASTNGTSGNVDLYGPQSTSSYKRINAKLTHLDSSGNYINAQASGQYLSTTALTGIRYQFSSGNITSGTIRVYGYTK